MPIKASSGVLFSSDRRTI